MAEKKTKPPADAPEGDVTFTPDPAFEQAAAPAARRYQVLASGISTPRGPFYQGETLDGAIIGDDARIQKLLEAGAIREVK